MDAQTRRRERRAEKQAQWKAANPLLVGVIQTSVDGSQACQMEKDGLSVRFTIQKTVRSAFGSGM